MIKTLAIVEIRLSHSQPVSKVGFKLGGKSLLEWVIRRATDCQKLDGVLVLLADDVEHRQFAELVPPDVPIFYSAKPTVLERLIEVIDKYHPQAVIRICADNPFLDPVLLDSLIHAAENSNNADYVSYCSANGEPTMYTPLGICAEWCTAKALRHAEREARTNADRAEPLQWILRNRQKFNVRLIPVPAGMDRDDVRLRVELEEDWDNAQVIYEALGAGDWDWQRIAGLLDQQPALRERMAVLNRHEAQE